MVLIRFRHPGQPGTNQVSARRDLLQLPRRARHSELRGAAASAKSNLLHLPRPGDAQRAAHQNAGGTHSSSRGDSRKRMRELPYAGDRDHDCECQRARAYVCVHHAGDDGEIQDPESLHFVPHR